MLAMIRIILLFIIGRLLFKSINQFLLKDSFLNEDMHILKRHFLITSFILALFAMLIQAYRWFDTGNLLYRDNFIFAVLMTGLQGFLILALKYLYKDRYRENRESLTYRGLFNTITIDFDEISRVKHIHSSKTGTVTILEMFDGKKLRLVHGFYNMERLKNYILLNAQENIYLTNQWVDLRKVRKSLPSCYEGEAYDFKIKLISRLDSYFHQFFRPRSRQLGLGCEQRPSTFFLYLALVLFVFASLIAYHAFQHLICADIIAWIHIENFIVDSFLALFIYYLAYKQYQVYKDNYYYENDRAFEVSYFSKKLELNYADFGDIEVRVNQIIFKNAGKDLDELNTIYTCKIYPQQVIDYLLNNYTIDKIEKNGQLNLKRK